MGVGYAIVLGLLMGIPTLRLRADYLAIVTIAVAEIVRLIVPVGLGRRTYSAAPTAFTRGTRASSNRSRTDLGIKPAAT